MSTPMLKLHEYVDELELVLDWIVEHEEQIVAAGGELPAELADLLEQVEGDLTEKVRRVALVIRNLTASAKAAHAEADRIASLARTYERQTESLKRYLMFQLQRAGTPRVETPTVKVRVQKNTKPSIRCVSAEIPEQFRRIRVEFDGIAAYDALKAAGCLPEEPGRIEIDGLVVELGQHVRVW
jgi:hypothetical protein